MGRDGADRHGVCRRIPGGYINFMQDDDHGKIRDNYRQNYDPPSPIPGIAPGPGQAAYDPGTLFNMNQHIAP